MRWWPWVALAAGGTAAIIAATGAPASRSSSSSSGRGKWSDPTAPQRIRELAAPIEVATGWDGLSDFLIAVAWWESRGNAAAVNPEGGQNAARGWFQIRPNSSDNRGIVANPSLLFDPAISVAIAADYAHRMALRWYRELGPDAPPVPWLAIRRGWACPALVDDRDEVESIPGCPPSADVRERFLQSLAAVGLPDEFAWRPAQPPGFQWPGQQAALGLALNVPRKRS